MMGKYVELSVITNKIPCRNTTSRQGILLKDPHVELLAALIFNNRMLVHDVAVFVSVTAVFAVNPHHALARRRLYMSRLPAFGANRIKLPVCMGHLIVSSPIFHSSSLIHLDYAHNLIYPVQLLLFSVEFKDKSCERTTTAGYKVAATMILMHVI